MNIMHTMASEARATPPPTRCIYSPELTPQVVSACAQPGASIAGVAMQHGINANIVHRWLREPTEPTPAHPTGDIRVEVKRANASIVVHWPLAGGADCAQWLRECLQ